MGGEAKEVGEAEGVEGKGGDEGGSDEVMLPSCMPSDIQDN